MTKIKGYFDLNGEIIVIPKIITVNGDNLWQKKLKDTIGYC